MSISISRNKRTRALEEGRSFYIGQACSHGHNGMRYTSNRACVECTKGIERTPYDPEAGRKAKAAYRAKVKARKADIGADLLNTI